MAPLSLAAGAWESGPVTARPPTLVVLGCRAVPGDGGLAASSALARRAAAAAEAARGAPEALVVAAGGRRWGGRAEACWLRAALVGAGVDDARIVRELVSLDTWENAREVRTLLGARGRAEAGVVLVTCAWHLPRARAAFESHGLSVRAEVPAADGQVGLARRGYRAGRERVAGWLDARRGARAPGGT